MATADFSEEELAEEPDMPEEVEEGAEAASGGYAYGGGSSGGSASAGGYSGPVTQYPVRLVASTGSGLPPISESEKPRTLEGPMFSKAEPEAAEAAQEAQGPVWKPEESNAAKADGAAGQKGGNKYFQRVCFRAYG